MRLPKTLLVCGCALGVLLVSHGTLMAQEDKKDEAPTVESLAKELAAVKETAENAALAGHNGWMLTCCALVLMMTAPGLAMFYSGLVRRKNVLGVMMQCIFMMGLMSVLWAIWGYSLAFGGSGKLLGNFEFMFMRGVQTEWVEGEPFTDENKNGKHDDEEPFTDTDEDGEYDAGHPHTPMEGSIPRLTHMLFQGMFIIITPALICGAFAERMRFGTMVVFMILWATVVYCPLAHWVWDGGILAFGDGWAGGALDFAGGTVVHISSGISALVCCLVMGKRLGFGAEDMRPHNMTYVVIGTALLWVGWFGFNAGSQLASDGVAASAFAATHFAAAAGGLAWAMMEWNTRGKPSVLGMCSGVVAGLVCITPASGFVTPVPAIFIGIAAGVVCFYACTKLKAHFGYDDSLDVFGIHGVGGTLGALLTGIFATRAVSDMDNGLGLGVYPDGEWRLLGGQIVAVIVTWIFAIIMTFGILKVLDSLMGLRVSQEEETEGLDLSQHGEEGYIFS